MWKGGRSLRHHGARNRRRPCANAQTGDENSISFMVGPLRDGESGRSTDKVRIEAPGVARKATALPRLRFSAPARALTPGAARPFPDLYKVQGHDSCLHRPGRPGPVRQPTTHHQHTMTPSPVAVATADAIADAGVVVAATAAVSAVVVVIAAVTVAVAIAIDTAVSPLPTNLRQHRRRCHCCLRLAPPLHPPPPPSPRTAFPPLLMPLKG